MSYSMRRLLNHLPIPFGLRSNRRLRGTRLKHAQLVSFLEDTGFRALNVDHYERSLRRRRVAKAMAIAVTALAVAWVALESARAVALY